MSNKQYLQDLSDSVVEMDEERAVRVATESLAAGVDPYDAIQMACPTAWLAPGSYRPGRSPCF